MQGGFIYLFMTQNTMVSFLKMFMSSSENISSIEPVNQQQPAKNFIFGMHFAFQIQHRGVGGTICMQWCLQYRLELQRPPFQLHTQTSVWSLSILRDSNSSLNTRYSLQANLDIGNLNISSCSETVNAALIDIFLLMTYSYNFGYMTEKGCCSMVSSQRLTVSPIPGKQ